MYPVELRYRPLKSKDEDEVEQDMEDAIVEAVDDLARTGGGDMLVFLPGEREMLVQVYLKRGCLVPLHPHESEQMTYVLQGALRFQVAGETIVASGFSRLSDGAKIRVINTEVLDKEPIKTTSPDQQSENKTGNGVRKRDDVGPKTGTAPKQ